MNRPNTRTIDLTIISAWLEVDVQWLEHVVDHKFECGCNLSHGTDELDIEHCLIWEAWQRKIKAEEDLKKANDAFVSATTTHLEKA